MSFWNRIFAQHMYLYTLLALTIFGVAVQNIIFTPILLGFVWVAYKNKSNFKSFASAHPVYVQSVFLSLGFILWITMATLINPINSIHLRNPFGYIGWALLPLLLAFYYPQGLGRPLEKNLGKFLAGLIFVWGLICLSQYIWGWRVLGSHFVSEGIEVVRPRGFYSHPLSLAYVAFLFFPAGLAWLLSSRKSIWPWLWVIGISIILLLTQSRTIQLVAFVIVIWNIIRLFKGAKRFYLLGAITVATLLFLSSSHPIAQKLKNTFNIEGVDRFSTYPDDRVLFWHAHLLMIQEKPVLGHGFDLNTAYRKPYYERLGFANFQKQYEAHNAFLQILAEGGIVALLLWVLWITRIFKLIALIRPVIAKRAFRQTFVGFLFAVLTQNGFQDAEVRFTLTIFCCALYLFTNSIAHKHHREETA
jgi:O-antigen ligase